MKYFGIIIAIAFCLLPTACMGDTTEAAVVVGAERAEEYFPLIEGKRIGVLTNHTGRVGDTHLVDFLYEAGMDIRYIFAPEHGFRGTADAGERVNDDLDPQTGIAIYSLYKSKTGAPGVEVMRQVDVVLFDLQDVGLRFYTYYISMLKMMEACAASHTPMIVLDRPNPNGFYIDGPVLDMKYKSGVGYLPIPVAHGMTLGELARMINGEDWLSGKTADLTVVSCLNYTHRTKYILPVAPSPNLPNMKSVYLYPSVCLFEGTPVSLGRGTEMPFQVFGSPAMKEFSFVFTPHSVAGAKNPPLLGQECYGVDLRTTPDEQIWEKGLNLEYLITAYRSMRMGEKFFQPFFEKLIGVDYVRKMIVAGASAEEIKSRWADDVERFRKLRRPYLLYEE